MGKWIKTLKQSPHLGCKTRMCFFYICICIYRDQIVCVHMYVCKCKRMYIRTLRTVIDTTTRLAGWQLEREWERLTVNSEQQERVLVLVKLPKRNFIRKMRKWGWERETTPKTQTKYMYIRLESKNNERHKNRYKFGLIKQQQQKDNRKIEIK